MKWFFLAAPTFMAFLSAGSTLAKDSVSLRFAWPSPVALRVERSFERVEIREPGPVPAPVKASGRYVWTGTRDGERYRVAFSDFEVVAEEPEPSSQDPVVLLEQMSRAEEPRLPTLFVDDEGQVVTLGGVAQLREQALSRFMAIPGIAEDPYAPALAQLLASEQVIELRALEDWSRLVQSWHGLDARIGDEEKVSGTSGEVSGAPFENVFGYKLVGRIPCAPGEAELSCVRLLLSQVPRITDTRSASQALLGVDIVTGFGAPPTATLEVENTFTIDTDPRTLLPVRYVKEKTWAVSWSDSNGASRRVGRADRWTYVFSTVR